MCGRRAWATALALARPARALEAGLEEEEEGGSGLMEWTAVDGRKADRGISSRIGGVKGVGCCCWCCWCWCCCRATACPASRAPNTARSSYRSIVPRRTSPAARCVRWPAL